MASQTPGHGQEALPPVNIKPLLTKLWPIDGSVTPEEIADAISHFFTNQVSEAQTASLLMALHFTKMDFRADVLARCAAAMLEAAAPIPVKELEAVIERRGMQEGNYRGGLVSSSSIESAHWAFSKTRFC
jgi:anthranilate phosphoribosyltransferase